jgi:hypothetical protein
MSKERVVVKRGVLEEAMERMAVRARAGRLGGGVNELAREVEVKEEGGCCGVVAVGADLRVQRWKRDRRRGRGSMECCQIWKPVEVRSIARAR